MSGEPCFIFMYCQAYITYMNKKPLHQFFTIKRANSIYILCVSKLLINSSLSLFSFPVSDQWEQESTDSRTPSPRKEMKMIWAGIRLLLMIVLLGYSMVWIVMPTKTFKGTWLPNLRKKLNSSTYFGNQGLRWLIFPEHSTEH